MNKATKSNVSRTISAVAAGESDNVELYAPRLHGGCAVIYRLTARGVVRDVVGPDGQHWGRRLVRGAA